MALSVSQIASITHRLILPKMVENIFGSNPVLFRLKDKGIKYSGGRVIQQPLVYKKTDAVGSFEGAEILSTTLNDNLTNAEFAWRQYYGTIGITGRDELLNSGKEGILNLLEAKRLVTELTLMDTMGTDLQGSNSSGKALDGLGSVLSDTTTYAGIATADFSDWKAKVRTLSVAGTLTLIEMQKAYGATVVGSDHPSVIVTRQSVFDKLWTLYQPDQRFTDSKMASAGFSTLMFNGIPIVVDSHVTGTDGGNQDNWIQFLNERYLWLATHSDSNFKVVAIPPLKDQDVKIVRILWAGNLLCSNRRMQGVIKTVDPNL